MFHLCRHRGIKGRDGVCGAEDGLEGDIGPWGPGEYLSVHPEEEEKKRMKRTLPSEVEAMRIKPGPYASDYTYGANGAFSIRNPLAQDNKSKIIFVIVSNQAGWDHLSASLTHRCPRWEEMEYLKRLFFEPDEIAYELHVAESKHINRHPYCLHIWRPQGIKIPLPPEIFV